MIRATRFALAACLVLGVAPLANAQSSATATKDAKAPPAAAKKDLNPGDKGAGATTLGTAERDFMMKAAKDGMAEVELGRMAEQKAANARVKEFGARMVADHGKAGEELKSLAGSKGVTLPAGPDKAQKAHADKLQKLSGADFDREYTRHMVDDHKKAVTLFEKTSKSARDAEVKAFAGKTLPTLQEHLKMAQAAQDASKGGGTAKGATDKGTADRKK